MPETERLQQIVLRITHLFDAHEMSASEEAAVASVLFGNALARLDPTEREAWLGGHVQVIRATIAKHQREAR
jgi:hypothetical protein